MRPAGFCFKQIIDRLKLVPLNQESVEERVAAFRNFSDEVSPFLPALWNFPPTSAESFCFSVADDIRSLSPVTIQTEFSNARPTSDIPRLVFCEYTYPHQVIVQISDSENTVSLVIRHVFGGTDS